MSPAMAIVSVASVAAGGPHRNHVSSKKCRLSLPQIKSGRIDDAVHQERTGRGCARLRPMLLVCTPDRDDASVVVGLPQTSPLIRNLKWEAKLKKLGPEGFRIRTISDANRVVVVIASTTDIGTLYGAFHFLRLLQTEQPIDHLQIDPK